MTDNGVRMLGETDWEVYRDLRLEALRESPGSFVASVEDEVQYSEESWRGQLRRSAWFVAEPDGDPVGIVGLDVHEQDPDAAEVVGLWVTPAARGSRVAWRLVRSAAERAFADGRPRLYFWVVSDDGPAVAFASAFGFRPTSERRSVATGEEGVEIEEVAMVLSLTRDPGSVINPLIP